MILALVAGMWGFLQKLISTKLKSLEEIIVKLIDRFNRSDESADRRFEALVEKFEHLESEVARLREKASYLTGRINSR